MARRSFLSNAFIVAPRSNSNFTIYKCGIYSWKEDIIQEGAAELQILVNSKISQLWNKVDHVDIAWYTM